MRIRDIWSELDARSGPLQKQAESAKKYLELRDELRLHEVSLWMDSLDGMKALRNSSEADRLEAEKQLEAVRGKQREQYSRSEQLTADIRQSDMQAERVQAELSAAEEDAASLSKRAAVLEESRRNAKENIQLAKGQIEAQQEQSGALSQQMQVRRARIAQLLSLIHI